MPADLAIIVPVFNEADNVLPLAREIAAALANETLSWELVFVEDGSTDPTWDRVLQAQRLDARVRGVRHAVNAGQSAAVWTGLRATTAPIVATLDGDRQNDPADLPRLLRELEQVDFVCGRRANRQDNFARRAASRIARWARRVVLGVDYRDTGCALRVFRRSALDGVFAFDGWHRFLPILAHHAGVSVKEVPVHHRPRTVGRSKYGVWNRLGRGVFDLVGVAWYLRRRLRPVVHDE